MTDELERIRSLRDEAPGPSSDWVEDTRAELLAMAAEEEAAAEEPVEPDRAPGPLAGLRRRLAELLDVAPPVAWAGAAAALVVVVAAVAVLGRGPAPPPTAEPTRQPSAPSTAGTSDPVVLAASCTGAGGGYTVDYPQDWHTNTGEVVEACQHFDEQPVDLEPQTGGGVATPVTVRVLPVGLDRATDAGPGAREVSRQQTTVAGREAVVLDWVATGEAALPEGVRSHRYVVDLGEQRTLLLVAHDVGDGPYEHYRRVVDEMAESVRLDD